MKMAYKNHTVTLIKSQACLLHSKLDHLSSPLLPLRPLAALRFNGSICKVCHWSPNPGYGPFCLLTARHRTDLEEALKFAKKMDYWPQYRAVHLSPNIFQHGHSWIQWPHQMSHEGDAVTTKLSKAFKTQKRAKEVLNKLIWTPKTMRDVFQRFSNGDNDKLSILP